MHQNIQKTAGVVSKSQNQRSKARQTPARISREWVSWWAKEGLHRPMSSPPPLSHSLRCMQPTALITAVGPNGPKSTDWRAAQLKKIQNTASHDPATQAAIACWLRRTFGSGQVKRTLTHYPLFRSPLQEAARALYAHAC